jgi:hypothetical protein
MSDKELITEKIIQEARIFVKRVEKGEIRSKRTYENFKTLLEEYDKIK